MFSRSHIRAGSPSVVVSCLSASCDVVQYFQLHDSLQKKTIFYLKNETRPESVDADDGLKWAEEEIEQK